MFYFLCFSTAVLSDRLLNSNVVLLQNDLLTKELTPLYPHHKIRIEIPHKTTCLPAPPLFSDLQWWLEHPEQRATEDMTSVTTEDMSSVAEGRVMLENQITSQEPKNHEEEIREEESWMRNLKRGSIEEESWRRNKGREIIEEESCRRNQRRGVIEEEPNSI